MNYMTIGGEKFDFWIVFRFLCYDRVMLGSPKYDPRACSGPPRSPIRPVLLFPKIQTWDETLAFSASPGQNPPWTKHTVRKQQATRPPPTTQPPPPHHA